jgi:16S rRNA (guanine966-N2)-methyltransferase
MRITGGKYCGRIVDVPKAAPGGKREIRPAMDRMRESVFAVLGDLTGLSFLDLFSGSGIGSRQVPGSPEKRHSCRRAHRVPFDARRTIPPAQQESVFNRLLRSALPLSISARSASRPVLRADGDRWRSCPVHFPSEDPLPDLCGQLRLVDERIYGRSQVRFYRKERPFG